MTLTQLAQRYGVDKLHAHGYLPMYEELFKGKTIKRLLEVGIGYKQLMADFTPFYVHGASLRMWHDAFPDAEIYSCDIREDTLINEGRIHSTLCDQSNVESLLQMLTQFGMEFDVVIDDGSHVPDHQLITARTLLAAGALASHGIYVIEDVRNFEIGTWLIQELVPFALKRRGASIDLFQGGKRPDDNAVVIKL